WSKLGALLHLKLLQLSSKLGVEYCCRTTDPSAVLTCLNVQERHFLIHVGKVLPNKSCRIPQGLHQHTFPAVGFVQHTFLHGLAIKCLGVFFNCNASSQREMKTDLNAEYMHSNKRRAIQHMDAKCPFTAPIQTQHPPPRGDAWHGGP
ncbi:hypothetical protein FQV08_0005214, partial [Pygoscelis antarcticus]